MVIMFYPEVQLKTILVLCLPDHTTAPQMAEQVASFGLKLQSCSDTKPAALPKFWESDIKVSQVKELWLIFEKSTSNSTTVKYKLKIKSMYSLSFSCAHIEDH